MRRREFIALLGGAATWPVIAGAQQSAPLPRIGFLGSASASRWAMPLDAFRSGLRDLGYVEGNNIIIEFRWAEGKYDRLDALAAELARLRVDVIVTHGTPGTRAAMRATTTIPVVMAVSGDAVATGLVTNLARPDANVTGSTYFSTELASKRLELLREISPRITNVAVLTTQGNPVNGPILKALETTGKLLHLGVKQIEVRGPDEFERAISGAAKGPIEGLLLTEDALIAADSDVIANIAVRNRLPSTGYVRFAQAGGLIGYGPNLFTLYRRAAYFVDKIIKGSKAIDLPVERPAKFALAINLKTAKALGLTIPPTLLARADEVIE